MWISSTPIGSRQLPQVMDIIDPNPNITHSDPPNRVQFIIYRFLSLPVRLTSIETLGRLQGQRHSTEDTRNLSQTSIRGLTLGSTCHTLHFELQHTLDTTWLLERRYFSRFVNPLTQSLRGILTVYPQVIILGDSGVGKTSLMNQYVRASRLFRNTHSYRTRSTRNSVAVTRLQQEPISLQKRFWLMIGWLQCRWVLSPVIWEQELC